MLLLTTNNTSKYVKQTYEFPKYEGLKKELQSIYINKNLPKSLKKDKKILISNTTCRLKMVYYSCYNLHFVVHVIPTSQQLHIYQKIHIL